MASPTRANAKSALAGEAEAAGLNHLSLRPWAQPTSPVAAATPAQPPRPRSAAAAATAPQDGGGAPSPGEAIVAVVPMSAGDEAAAVAAQPGSADEVLTPPPPATATALAAARSSSDALAKPESSPLRAVPEDAPIDTGTAAAPASVPVTPPPADQSGTKASGAASPERRQASTSDHGDSMVLVTVGSEITDLLSRVQGGSPVATGAESANSSLMISEALAPLDSTSARLPPARDVPRDVAKAPRRGPSSTGSGGASAGLGQGRTLEDSLQVSDVLLETRC